jgi:hypothetical protein
MTFYSFGQSQIIGVTIKLSNIEVAQFDFQNAMNFSDATKACEALRKDWRLPTKQELKTLLSKKDKLGGFNGKL